MKIRLPIFLLIVSMIISVFPVQVCAVNAAPAAPDWIQKEDYIIIPVDNLYESSRWNDILKLRKDAAEGKTFTKEESEADYRLKESPAFFYELGLIRMKMAETIFLSSGDASYFLSAGEMFDRALHYLSSDYTDYSDYKKLMAHDEYDYINSRIKIMIAQCKLLSGASAGRIRLFDDKTVDLFPDIVDRLTGGPFSYILTEEQIEQIKKEYKEFCGTLSIWLDGQKLNMRGYGADPEIKGGRTMVPIRFVAERLGANVEWDAASSRVIMVRAGTTIIMTIGKQQAAINGKDFLMDVAPYIKNGRTMVPARYVAEFFGQIVSWNGTFSRVLIDEDKSVGDSNLEQWACAMGAMLSYLNYGTVSFGKHRTEDVIISGGLTIPMKVTASQHARSQLSSAWGIEDREDLIYIAKMLSDADGYICWDLFRLSSVVQWGYTAGYVTYKEALDLIKPGAEQVCRNFSSWDDAYRNYLLGYCQWVGEEVTTDIWSSERGVYYIRIRDKIAPEVFDNILFSTGVIPIS